MEIEAKFRVDDQRTFDDLLSLTALGPFRLVPAPNPEDQHNIYFDTVDGRLRVARYGLRVRDLGARRIATLKGDAHVVDGVYEREEWEAPIGDDDRPEHWPPSEARERTLALLGGAQLIPILTIYTLRRHIYASRDGSDVAEISLDEGTISANGREEHLRELEIELLGMATRADLDELAALLRVRYPLAPEERSKLARGLALLDLPPTTDHRPPTTDSENREP
jgi:inorganic triphosphatase YgiF